MALLALGPGCGGDAGGDGVQQQNPPTAGFQVPVGGTGGTAGQAAGMSMPTAMSTTMLTGGGQAPGAMMNGVMLPAGMIPCDVASVLYMHCTRCHGSMLREGAPMALVSPEDFQRERNGRPVMASVVERLHDPQRRMPPLTEAPMTPDEIGMIEGWINGGAMAIAGGCTAEDASSQSMMQAGAGGTSGGGPPIVVEDPPVMTGGEITGARWTLFGYDLDNSRSNPDETTISPENVGSLVRLWQVSLPGSTSTPVVADGVIYLPSWDSSVYALRAEDGGQLWATPMPDLIDSSAAVTADRVFISDDAGALHALDRATGMVVWTTQLDPHPETHLWSSPVYVEEANLIVIGVASSDEVLPLGSQTFRGSVVGVDADGGEVRWRFDTTSGGESGVGIGVWSSAAVDTVRKLAFIGTGNNYTEPTGPYADSMLAINYETGELEWSRQFTDNDVFIVIGGLGPDFDIGSTPNLFAADGQDLVGIGVKSGIYYALDRDSGAVRWMAQVSEGSVLGGVISASAYHDGLIFVASNHGLVGGTRVVALRADNGMEAWGTDIGGATYAGVAHANGVVYVGSTDGTLHAYDAATGQERFTDSAPDAIAGGPSVVDGMLLVPWGYQWTLRDGVPANGGLIAYGL